MGVPKFYRWVSERYPCLSETVKEFQVRNRKLSVGVQYKLYYWENCTTFQQSDLRSNKTEC